MYPNPLIQRHAGIYLKEIADNDTHLEIYELRPDLLISWSIVESIADGLNALDMRGNWVVSSERLSLFLIDDDNEAMYQEHYRWTGNNWQSEKEPEVTLKKRNGLEDIKDDLYFDSF